MPAETVSARLNRLTLLNNIPLGAQLELTYGCPLRCSHCYLPEACRNSPRKELSEREWKGVIKKLMGLGTLSLVFTGGEPLLRPDLPDLCLYAGKLGFEVRVFTSGAGLTPALIRSLRPANISAFELSFYGRPRVHDGLTGLPGSCRKTLAAAKALKRAGFRVKLKTPLMKPVAGELGYIVRLARENDFGYSFDPVLTGSSDGGDAKASLRLPAARLRALISDRKVNPREENSCPAAALDSPVCGAGRNTVSINAYGDVYPCLQLGVKLGNVRRRSLAGIWKNSAWLKKWRKVKISDLEACRSCPDLDFCSRCPGISLLETGNINSPYKTACLIAKTARLGSGVRP
ncbi:MAG TPA: hypothetical protein DCZ92_03990 [Elusimicrobia bacterium]|nr:hypothetical protein [Elusimicrobiota bacterium]